MLTYTVCITKSEPEGFCNTVLSLSRQIRVLFLEVVTNEAVLFTDKTLKEQCMNSDFLCKCVGGGVCVCVKYHEASLIWRFWCY